MYITVEEAKSFGVTGTDAQVETYISQAESILHNLCCVDSFCVETIEDERHDYSGNGCYLLRRKPNSITKINGTAVSLTEWEDYMLTGRRVDFADSVTINYKNTNRNFVEFSYESGYSVIPSDIKNAMLILTSWVQSQAKGVGLSSYTQWDISVTYSNNNSIFGNTNDQNRMIGSIVSKYKFIDIHSV